MEQPVLAGASGGGFDAIAYPSVTTCVAVVTTPAGSGFNFLPAIDTTTDGGATWTSESVPSGDAWLFAVSCPAMSTCFAAGAANIFGTAANGVLTTKDGGATWTPQSLPSGKGRSGVNVLGAISCPSTAQCFASGSNLVGAPPPGILTGAAPGAILLSY